MLDMLFIKYLIKKYLFWYYNYILDDDLINKVNKVNIIIYRKYFIKIYIFDIKNNK